MRHRPTRKITHRVSSVTNGFVQAILPNVLPDPVEHSKVLAILEIDPVRLVCAYCGDPARHWDHLNPYVRNKRPSGYLNEARNLVPACDLCNTSKSGQPWRTWIIGSAKGSPKTRRISDLDCRVERLDRLEADMGLRPRNLADLIAPEIWDRYWQRLDDIERLLFEAQRDATVIREHLTSLLAVRP